MRRRERREGRRKSKGVTSSEKTRLKSKRPTKQEEEGGAGVEGEFFGVLPHSAYDIISSARRIYRRRRFRPRSKKF